MQYSRLWSSLIVVAILVSAARSRAESISEYEQKVDAALGRVLFGLVLARRWTPLGHAREVISRALSDAYQQFCGAKLYAEEIDHKYPARRLHRAISVGCYSVEFRAAPVPEECVLAEVSLTDREGSDLRHTIDVYYGATEIERVDAARDVVSLVRRSCRSPSFQSWCIEEIWEPQGLKGRAELQCRPAFEESRSNDLERR